MQRYFIESDQFGERTVTVTGEDAHHIGKVMRSKPGDEFIVSDGVSRDALVKLVSLEAQTVSAEILEWLEQKGEPWMKVTLVQSLPKGDKIETVIQKCTEIGVEGVLPLISERTVVQYDGKKEEKRIARWRKIAKEAAEQSHRSRIPAVESPISWKGLLRQWDRFDLVCICYEKENGGGLRDVIRPLVEATPRDKICHIAVVVGPEGGFSEREIQEAEEAGAVSASLGRRILRTETAGMAALTCIMYESGEMGGM